MTPLTPASRHQVEACPPTPFAASGWRLHPHDAREPPPGGGLSPDSLRRILGWHRGLRRGSALPSEKKVADAHAGAGGAPLLLLLLPALLPIAMSTMAAKSLGARAFHLSGSLLRLRALALCVDASFPAVLSVARGRMSSVEDRFFRVPLRPYVQPALGRRTPLTRSGLPSAAIAARRCVSSWGEAPPLAEQDCQGRLAEGGRRHCGVRAGAGIGRRRVLGIVQSVTRDVDSSAVAAALDSNR